jgi:F0F1-type ATP synthase epsilon subunit
MPDRLRFIVRTPHAVVVDEPVVSARVLAETGHLGLRPRMEPIAIAVEAGLVPMRADGRVEFVGVAGGLLACDGRVATLFTPLAVTGPDPAAIERALDRALAEPGAEQKLRAALDRLEGRILTELRRRPTRGEVP